MLHRRFGRHQVHRAEAAGVVERNPRAAFHVKDHMVMLLRCGVVMMELAQHHARNQHSPRHAKVDQQRLARIEVGQDVLRPPRSAVIRLPVSRSAIPTGKGQRRSGRLTSARAITAPSRTGKQATADGFNFGQFGHGCLPDSWAHCGRRVADYKEGHATDRKAQGTARTMTDEKTTHFGFTDVPEGEKAGMVHGVFSRVASKYDVMNDLMSLGIHRVWKDAMMDWLAPRNGQRLLDVAGGTGDVAFRFLKRAPGASAVVCDMTEPMLIEGRKRAEAEKLATSLDWVVGDAMALPFPDASFDVYTISFGIRNVTRIPDALAEAYRVLKPGGRIMVLEFSQIPNDLMQKAYDLYSFNVIPAMGQVVAGDRASYQYLVESIRKFPDQESFAALIRDAGFGQVKYRNLSMGIAALHSGWKL
jgi:demethylmenaquinone methyltransferase / 2-methoxy-6-polyprenyl-1,4-benzoquinol methylase